MTPPPDQLNIPRLGLLYFSRPGARTPMKAVPSPLLDRLGLLTEKDKEPNQTTVTGTEYVRSVFIFLLKQHSSGRSCLCRTWRTRTARTKIPLSPPSFALAIPTALIQIRLLTSASRARVKDVHHKTVLDKREGTSFEFKGLKVQNYYD